MLVAFPGHVHLFFVFCVFRWNEKKSKKLIIICPIQDFEADFKSASIENQPQNP